MSISNTMYAIGRPHRANIRKANALVLALKVWSKALENMEIFYWIRRSVTLGLSGNISLLSLL